ncbi:prion-inhibition and propagation-domain-containing protein [Annulohypoxylon truncatum]|uniref:prion-inhibition and propagation-domain-containing protein n=1 Tax=Annulohypoxylon truncatum TaxID=327061 RepID=UPI002007A10A|nr:prion-inhibition and propagation-domain-containing protein [Annulohypoxylon truncatum]KAI1211926.1 prion-inhibition and propagation-domain-containing protein [Annulohypoxylon truncatum]
MAEAAGLAAGAVGIAIAFKGAVDTALFIGSFFDNGKREYGSVALAYHIQKVRLELWGNQCKVTDTDDGMLREKPLFIKDAVVRILGQIEKLNGEVNFLANKYGIVTSMTDVPDTDLNRNLHPGSDLVKNIAKEGSREPKLKSVVGWVIRAKSDFKEKVDEIRNLITHLQEITLQPREIQLLNNSLEGPVLAPIRREDFPELLVELDTGTRQSLALSAHAKLLQSRICLNSTGSVTYIGQQQIVPVRGSPGPDNIYSLKRHDGQSLTVRIEWNKLSAGPDTQQYIDRINSLGYILERVSEPALRLPPCYGVYDDMEYEIKHKMKSREDVYDGDLLSHPPISLSDRIKQKGPIPLLGERFQLAYTLACAFSRFHAAGWLHKGFHSGSIIFFHKRGGQGVDVTEPFVTGFQYSRPQGASSLSFSPLDNKGLGYYYHPDAHKGSTRRLDLYSLGVVLYELGRWGLLADRKEQLGNRTQWRKYLLTRGFKDLGWRMGDKYQSVVKTLLDCDLPPDDADHEYFAQKYLEKVMRPLSSCSA